MLMTRRPDWMEVLGGHYVFPGGLLEERDWSVAMLARCRGLAAAEARAILADSLSPELSLAHWIAAIRELFEETGVLLGITEDNQAPLAERRAELERRRQDLVRGIQTFDRILQAEGLYCDASRLSYFMHRITPEENRARFDTRFFLAALPAGQRPLPRSEEVAQSVWVTPKEALQEAARGAMLMIRPTRIVLERLAEFPSWAELWKAHGQTPVRR